MLPYSFVFVALVAGACSQAPAAPPAAAASAAAQGPSASPDRAAVVATVDGAAITVGEVDGTIALELAKLQEQIHGLRRQQLDELIEARLIAAEAKRRGVAVEALIQQEVANHVTPVTQGEIDAFVAANRARIPGDATTLVPQIRAYLENQKQQGRRAAFVASLRAKAKVDITLKAPDVARATVEVAGAPVRGPEAAPVSVVEFSDFHCPFCKRVQSTLTALQAKYPNEVKLVYKHYPIDSLHPQARAVSEAGWCAQQQGRFWPFHDRVYAGGADGSAATMQKLAGEAGLDLAAFGACLASGKAAAAVEKDIEEAQRFGITGTPAFFVNGRFLSGAQPLEAFVAIVDEELRR